MEPPYVLMGGEVEAQAELSKNGHWTVAGITQSIAWTQKAATITYAGRIFVLLPEDADHHPAIALREERDTARRAILQLASALSWVNRGHVTVDSWGGGSRPFRMGKKKLGGQIIASKFQIDYLPEAKNKKQQLALAMYHEGASLLYTHVAYSFLSFYKIINLVSGTTGKEQIAWINAQLAVIGNHRTSERLKLLQKDGVNVGEYIYQSCRCAIAHAGDPRNPVIDPHDINDQKRLHTDLPLVTALAEVALEKELGIKSLHTVYGEHRYELSGFERFFPPEVLQQLKAGAEIEKGSLDLPSAFSVRMWGIAPYPVLEGVIPKYSSAEKGVVSVTCLTKSGRHVVVIKMDFVQYRLHVEIGMLQGINDDGTVGFVEEQRDLDKFFFDWNGNGKLEIWSDEGECLGRRDAFIPVNVFLDRNAYKAAMNQFNDEIERRRKAAL